MHSHSNGEYGVIYERGNRKTTSRDLLLSKGDLSNIVFKCTKTFGSENPFTCPRVYCLLLPRYPFIVSSGTSL